MPKPQHIGAPRRPGGRWRAKRAAAILAIVAGGAVALGGCGTSPPTRFYTVEPVMPSSPSVPAVPAVPAAGATAVGATAVGATAVGATAVGAAAYAGPPLRVRAVHLPPAWDRNELIREVGPGQVQVREFDQWAAPLGRSARQALIQDLATRLPAGKVMLSLAGLNTSSSGVAPAELSVDILMLRIDGRLASMQASWSVRRSPTDPWRSPPPALLELPLAGDGGDATALALSRLIGQLADRIAADLGHGADPG